MDESSFCRKQISTECMQYPVLASNTVNKPETGLTLFNFYTTNRAYELAVAASVTKKIYSSRMKKLKCKIYCIF